MPLNQDKTSNGKQIEQTIAHNYFVFYSCIESTHRPGSDTTVGERSNNSKKFLRVTNTWRPAKWLPQSPTQGVQVTIGEADGADPQTTRDQPNENQSRHCQHGAPEGGSGSGFHILATLE